MIGISKAELDQMGETRLNAYLRTVPHVLDLTATAQATKTAEILAHILAKMFAK